MSIITNKIFYFIIFILLAIGSVRIIVTYDQLTIGQDEPIHVATGIEWLENGTYYLEALHPPLARISVAILPYLAGAKLGKSFYQQYAYPFNDPKGYMNSFEGRIKGGEIIFFGQDYNHYKKMVFLSRLGLIPYFLLGGVVLAIWTRRLFGEYSAVITTLFYTTLPIILANAGLAMTDLPMCTLFLCTLFSFLSWLEKASVRNTLLFGISISLLTITKFTGPIFFLIVGAPIILTKDFATKIVSKGFSLQRIYSILFIILIGFVTILAIYRFEFAKISYPYFLDQSSIETLKAFLIKNNFSKDWTNYLLTVPIVPFPEFFHGLSDLIDRNAIPYAGYIFGKVLIYRGVWYFFLAATLYKTPIPFILFSLLGVYFIFRKFKQSNEWKLLIPVVVIITLYLASIAFNINIGLRHLLPVFPLFCIIAGFATYVLLTSSKWIIKIFTIILLSGYLVSSFSASPYYISYFNILAGGQPENILLDSDFDIGHELEQVIQIPEIKQNLTQTKLYYAGLANPKFFGFRSYVVAQLEMHKKHFKIYYNNEKYMLISIALLKILPSKLYASIENCKVKRKVGQTFMYYDLNSCQN